MLETKKSELKEIRYIFRGENIFSNFLIFVMLFTDKMNDLVWTKQFIREPQKSRDRWGPAENIFHRAFTWVEFSNFTPRSLLHGPFNEKFPGFSEGYQGLENVSFYRKKR